MATRPKAYIPQGSDLLTEKFICCLMNRGKKAQPVASLQTLWMLSKLAQRRTNGGLQQGSSTSLRSLKSAQSVLPVLCTKFQPAKPKASDITFHPLDLMAARARKGVQMAEKLAMELLDASAEQGAAIKKEGRRVQDGSG